MKNRIFLQHIRHMDDNIYDLKRRSVGIGRLHCMAYKHLFDLIEEVRPNAEDLIDEELRIELISLLERIRRWDARGNL